LLAGLAFNAILWRIVRKITGRTRNVLDNAIVVHLTSPSRLIIPVVMVYLALPGISGGLPSRFAAALDNLLSALLTAAMAWLVISTLYIAEDFILSREDLKAADNLQARKIYTQIQVLKRILIALISILALAGILLHYEEFRRLGTSILASAGLAGLVVGLAAQRTLANLLAGFQIAITQPIRLDDVVVVEGEWGTIEEITLTYVVVRIWDLRRLVVPLSNFIEKPFENWTRTSADLLATVLIYADYSLPVEDLRDKLHLILSRSNYWDRKVERIHVTNASERTLEVRALMSAANSSDAWELRCEVREKLIAFLRQEHPECLPRLRTELHPLDLAALKLHQHLGPGSENP